MKNHHNSEAAVTAACVVIGRMTSTPEIALLTGATCASSLVAAMVEFTTSSDVQENCCVTINKLVYSDGKTVVANQDCLGKGTQNHVFPPWDANLFFFFS